MRILERPRQEFTAETVERELRIERAQVGEYRRGVAYRKDDGDHSPLETQRKDAQLACAGERAGNVPHEGSRAIGFDHSCFAGAMPSFRMQVDQRREQLRLRMAGELEMQFAQRARFFTVTPEVPLEILRQVRK